VGMLQRRWFEHGIDMVEFLCDEWERAAFTSVVADYYHGEIEPARIHPSAH
jgi:hypothetical protein